MRKAFVKALCEIAAKDKRVFLLTGDLGYNILEPFKELFPDRFLNVGVAESNLITVAAGLSTTGFIPFVYSIATFASMRAFEQVRNTIALQNLNVKIVGVGAGFAYSKAGPTHYAIEDIALMRTIPNMIILAPADSVDAYSATKALALNNGPSYMRFDRNPEKNVYSSSHKFIIGNVTIIKEGGKIAFIATGAQVANAILVSERLQKRDIASSIYAFSTIRPFDKKKLQEIIKKHQIIATLEEHNISGGLASEIMEFIYSKNVNTKLLRFGIQNVNKSISAEYKKIITLQKFSFQQIAIRIQKEVLKLKNSDFV